MYHHSTLWDLRQAGETLSQSLHLYVICICTRILEITTMTTLNLATGTITTMIRMMMTIKTARAIVIMMIIVVLIVTIKMPDGAHPTSTQLRILVRRCPVVLESKPDVAWQRYLSLGLQTAIRIYFRPKSGQ